jgi:hypothetical protein
VLPEGFPLQNVICKLQIWIGNGIFSAQHGPHSPDRGQLWMASRKTAAHIFTRQNFRDLMHTTFREKADIFIDVLKNSTPGKPIDMQQKFFAFTMDSVMSIFFGRTTSTLKGTFDRFANAFDEAHRWLVQILGGSIYYLGLILFILSTFFPVVS